MAAVVAILLISGVAYIANYDPLCSLNCGGVSGVNGLTVKALGDFSSPTGESFNAWQVTHRPGSDFSFWLTLTNNGPLSVTITHIGAPPDTFDPVPVAHVQLERPEARSMDSVEEFHPFSLAPGGNPKNVLVTMRMRGCLQAGSAQTFGAFR